MPAIAFDTLAYAKKPESAGFTTEQAQVQTEGMANLINDNLATKQDIIDLKRDLKELEMRITVRLGGIIVTGIVVIATMTKIL